MGQNEQKIINAMVPETTLTIEQVRVVPPSNMNRNDSNDAKTLDYCGTERAYHSSQSLNSAYRLQLQTDEVLSQYCKTLFTREVPSILRDLLIERGMDADKAKAIGVSIGSTFSPLDFDNYVKDEAAGKNPVFHLKNRWALPESVANLYADFVMGLDKKTIDTAVKDYEAFEKKSLEGARKAAAKKKGKKKEDEATEEVLGDEQTKAKEKEEKVFKSSFTDIVMKFTIANKLQITNATDSFDLRTTGTCITNPDLAELNISSFLARSFGVAATESTLQYDAMTAHDSITGVAAHLGTVCHISCVMVYGTVISLDRLKVAAESVGAKDVMRDLMCICIRHAVATQPLAHHHSLAGHTDPSYVRLVTRTKGFTTLPGVGAIASPVTPRGKEDIVLTVINKVRKLGAPSKAMYPGAVVNIYESKVPDSLENGLGYDIGEWVAQTVEEIVDNYLGADNGISKVKTEDTTKKSKKK